MAFLLVTMTYPPYQAKELGKQYLQVAKSKLPSFLKISNLFTTTDPKYGIKVYALYEVEDDKILDGMKAIVTRYDPFSGIEGWIYNIETLLEVKDALPLIGLT